MNTMHTFTRTLTWIGKLLTRLASSTEMEPTAIDRISLSPKATKPAEPTIGERLILGWSGGGRR